MSASGPSRAEPSRDATGDVIAWCKGGLSVAVAGSLGRKSVRAMGKKPSIGGPDGPLAALAGPRRDRCGCRSIAVQPFRHHCLDLAKVQTQQGLLFFLILAVGCEWRVLVAQVTCGCRVLVAAVTQPTWQEITRHRLGSGAQLEKLKLNF